MEDGDGSVMMMTGNGNTEPPDFEVTLLEPRPFRPFKSSEEYLYAMKEDLAEWLNGLYEGLHLDADNFLEQMETGVILCQHANNVVRKAREYYRSGNAVHGDVPIPDRDVVYRYDVLPETFHARDNVSNFISWCRSLNIKECLLFETDDLVLRKNERSFILCLLEVARKGVKFGMPAPLLVQLEQEIDAEIANDDDGYETLYNKPQVVTNDLRSLHERVVELLSRCTCPSQFPMIRVADGKYRIGDTKVLIFVRILRSHVMVRVGGGWDTLEHYLDKHDPCRCRSGHRLATSAKLTMLQGKSSIPSMHVTYNRPSQAPSSTPSSPQNPRRSLSYMSPTMARRSQYQSSSPPTCGRPLPPTICSDDSSNSSLQDTLDRRLTKKSPVRRVSRNGDESSSDDDASDDENYKSSLRRRPERRELIFKDSVPSSWKYSPSVPRKDYQPQQQQYNAVAFGSGQPRKTLDSHSSKLPALTPRLEGKQPPKIGKVAPRPHYPPTINEPRSQSSEDLFQSPASGPVQPRSLIFHSRGPSPINVKARSIVTPEGGFRRNDPKRHSSPRINHRPDAKIQFSPPKFLSAKNIPSPMPNPRSIAVNGTPNRRMFWSPERQPPSRNLVTRKNSAPALDTMSSPVLEKLLQNNDLCSDKNFLMKIEELIAEFQAKTKFDETDNYVKVQYNSLPTHLESQIDSKCSLTHPRRSPTENNNVGKSPSKIPVPTWYSSAIPKSQNIVNRI